MAHINVVKTNFTAGEISPRLLGRGDLRAYDNGASKLRNVFIHPTGGLTRRNGLRYVAKARGHGRLVAFEFNVQQVYLLVFTDKYIEVYRNGVRVAGIAAPWTLAQIASINWTQSADTLLVVHPDVPPKKITRTSETNWTIKNWSYLEKDDRVYQPHHKFAGDDVTLAASGTSGSVTLTASASVFVSGHVGTRFRIGDKELRITSFISATRVRASAKENLTSTTATKDWSEQAFSTVRGWPVSVCFHQDRTVIGGSRDLPNRLWLSKSADLFNFDLGEGLDDEGIEFAILSDQVNAVRAVFSGRHLQVFTSGAEWMLTGIPLTPANMELHRQTQIGSPVDRTVQPVNVDGATLFVPRNGAELREFLFAEVEQAYQASDLAMLAHHLLDKTMDQDFNKSERLFHMVLKNGKLATVTIFRAEQVTAWSIQETVGSFKSIAMVGEDTYFLVHRSGGVFIERFDPDMNVDSGLLEKATSTRKSWSGLSHLEGKTVKVLADGAIVPDVMISGGSVTLTHAASRVEAGLGYSHYIVPLPPSSSGSATASATGAVRPVALTFRLRETFSLRLDTGRGYFDVPFRRMGQMTLDTSPEAFSGDKTIRALGWSRDVTKPLWKISSDQPLPFQLLSVASEMSVIAREKEFTEFKRSNAKLVEKVSDIARVIFQIKWLFVGGIIVLLGSEAGLLQVLRMAL